jgi:mannose-6-phosphate isomerase-like protein (cupin superfamily)
MEPGAPRRRIMSMKKTLALAAALAAAGLAYGVGRTQDAAYADASPAFAQLKADMTGAVAAPITHAPMGDVLAVYIGRTAHEMYANEDQLLIVISGHGTANVGYPTYQLKPGSVVSIPRDTAFQIIAQGRAPIKAYVLASPSDNPNNKKVLEP